jgi:hypothetical protein
MLMQHRKSKKEAENQKQDKGSLLESEYQANFTADTNTKSIPLLGESFYTGRNTLLAAGGGSGKSLLSIFLAFKAFSLKAISKACFFVLEKKDQKLIQRYTEGLKKNEYIVINLETFNKRKKQLETNEVADTFYRRNYLLKNPEDKWLYELYISKKKNKPINLFTFLLIFREMVSQGYDFIVLDSLGDIFDKTFNITKELVNALLESSYEPGLTFLVLHHLNDEEKITGPRVIRDCFETVYKIDRIKFDKNNYDADLYISEDKNNYKHEPPLCVKRTCVSEYVADYEELNNPDFKIWPAPKKDSLKNDILEYIQRAGVKGCAFDELYNSMLKIRPGTNDESVKTYLRKFNRDENIPIIVDDKNYSKVVISERS